GAAARLAVRPRGAAGAADNSVRSVAGDLAEYAERIGAAAGRSTGGGGARAARRDIAAQPGARFSRHQFFAAGVTRPVLHLFQRLSRDSPIHADADRFTVVARR